MAKVCVYISDKLQDMGYRPFIIQKILDSDLEGTARNLPDGRIEVLLEGKKKSIQKFVEMLKKEKPELAENPAVSEIEFNQNITVPKVMRVSQAMVLEQISKGVGVLADTKNSLTDIKNSFIDTKNSLNNINSTLIQMPAKIAEELKKVLMQK